MKEVDGTLFPHSFETSFKTSGAWQVPRAYGRTRIRGRSDEYRTPKEIVLRIRGWVPDPFPTPSPPLRPPTSSVQDSDSVHVPSRTVDRHLGVSRTDSPRELRLPFRRVYRGSPVHFHLCPCRSVTGRSYDSMCPLAL